MELLCKVFQLFNVECQSQELDETGLCLNQLHFFLIQEGSLFPFVLNSQICFIVSLTIDLMRSILSILAGRAFPGYHITYYLNFHITYYLNFFTGDVSDLLAWKADVLPLNHGASLVRKMYRLASFLSKLLRKYCCLLFCQQ